jgi:twitching motility two-component system response regulator PilH
MVKILIADDSNTDKKYIFDALKDTGFDLISASDGEEAEQKAKAGNFDLIILDVVMPKKNGFQVCRAIKQDANLRGIPVILLTSKTQDSDKFWGRKQGADEYITKPFEPAVLMSAVKKFVGG